MLEEAILEAISKLEETKRSFKSRKIKEVREKLIEVITGQGRSWLFLLPARPRPMRSMI
jgi:hypothetical protein